MGGDRLLCRQGPHAVRWAKLALFRSPPRRTSSGRAKRRLPRTADGARIALCFLRRNAEQKRAANPSMLGLDDVRLRDDAAEPVAKRRARARRHRVDLVQYEELGSLELSSYAQARLERLDAIADGFSVSDNDDTIYAKARH